MGTVDCRKRCHRQKNYQISRSILIVVLPDNRWFRRLDRKIGLNWEYNVNILVLLCCVSCHAPGVVVNNVVVVSTVVVVGSTLVVFSAVDVDFMVIKHYVLFYNRSTF